MKSRQAEDSFEDEPRPPVALTYVLTRVSLLGVGAVAGALITWFLVKAATAGGPDAPLLSHVFIAGLSAAGGVALVGWSLLRAYRRSQGDRRADRGLRPISNWLQLVAALVVIAVGAGLTWWLHSIATSGGPDASVRIDAVRTGLGAAAGAAAAFALLLAFRRQHATEVSAVNTIKDADERRVTELYTKAADQLGSDKAPVRLAGLYALERLAQSSPGQRQTIVNVICAYLQMPYTSPEAARPEPNAA